MSDTTSHIENVIMINPHPTSKVNTLAGLAFFVLIGCLVALVLMTDLNSDAKAMITLVVGRFMGYIDNIYSFEFGQTRSNIKKDETIETLGKTTVPAAVVSATIPTQPKV